MRMLPQAEESLAFAIYSKNGDTSAVYFVFLLDGKVLGPGGRGLISFFSFSWTYFAHFRSNFSNPSLTRVCNVHKVQVFYPSRASVYPHHGTWVSSSSTFLVGKVWLTRSSCKGAVLAIMKSCASGTSPTPERHRQHHQESW